MLRERPIHDICCLVRTLVGSYVVKTLLQALGLVEAARRSDSDGVEHITRVI
jgi:hypothetical protein